jgi:hypothetical protein
MLIYVVNIHCACCINGTDENRIVHSHDEQIKNIRSQPDTANETDQESNQQTLSNVLLRQYRE